MGLIFDVVTFGHHAPSVTRTLRTVGAHLLGGLGHPATLVSNPHPALGLPSVEFLGLTSFLGVSMAPPAVPLMLHFEWP